MQKSAGSEDRIVRVAHLSSGHHADDTRIFWKECLSLARTGRFDVSLTIPEEHPSRLPGLPAEVEVSVVRSRPGRRGRMLITPWPLLAAGLRRKAEIYHVHDPEMLFAALLLRLMGKTVIYDAHEDVPRDILARAWVPSPLRGLLARAAGAFEWFAGQTLSGVIAATPVIARRFPASRTALVQNFARISEFPEPSAWLADSPPALAYVGGITVDRCAPEMVEAVARLDRFPGARLIMAGGIHPPDLEKRLAGMPGWDRVDYRGIQDRPGVLRILAESRIGLVLFHPLQNYAEAQPVKLYEYMAAGLPVVATDLPRLRKTIEAHCCGICVPPRDVDATTRAIERLLDHPAEAAEMGRRGREAAMKFFSWESEERTLLEFYRRIAGISHSEPRRICMSAHDTAIPTRRTHPRDLLTPGTGADPGRSGEVVGKNENNLGTLHITPQV
jgi:glycosyltransferase involved in cell wall biosynthesis